MRLILALLSLSLMASASQDEAYGLVTNVVDGDTFDVAIERAYQRTLSGVERVRLADVNSPEIDTPEGPAARDFTYAVLMNRRIYLDIDDLSGSGRDEYGRLICVAYLTGFYGQPLSSPCFNRMLVDSGHGSLENFTDNEFDPDVWWSGGSIIWNSTARFLLDLWRMVEGSARGELDRLVKEILRWLESNPPAS